ncbi:MAG: GntR family transcriptional regulator [Pseudomonadota bacterium]
MRQVDLTRRIVDILRRQQAPEGFHVREQWLADALGVSRSPVRRALQQLEQMNVLRSEQNQGYFMAVAADSGAFRNIALPETEVERIRTLIASERFATLLGDQVSVGDLCQRYGASRATILKVLARMQEEGLVEKTAGHGWMLRPALNDEAAYLESARFRRLLEPAVFTEPDFMLDPSALEDLLASQNALAERSAQNEPLQALFDADAAFHERLAEASGNRFLTQAIRQITRVRRLSEPERYVTRERLAESFREHGEVLKAIKADDPGLAAKRMADHIDRAHAARPDIRKVRALAHRRLTRR